MPTPYAFPFSPTVRLLFNTGTTAIDLGAAVEWSGTVANVEDPIPEPAMGKKPMMANQATRSSATTRPVMGIKHFAPTAANDDEYNPIVGVARESIAASSWGEVCVAGPCDVLIAGGASANNIAAGDDLVAITGGRFIEDTTSVTAIVVVHAKALEATIASGTCTAALISALLNDTGINAFGKSAAHA